MSRFRKWINRDDGRYYRVGNKDLSLVEIIGAGLLIVALFLLVLKQKADLNVPSWSIATAFAGCGLLFWLGSK